MYTIGVDLGATFVKMGIVDNKGRVYSRRKIDTPKGAKKALLIDAIIYNIRDIIKKSGKKIRGVGIGVPGPVDSKKGIVHYFPNIKGWKEVPLKAILQKRLGMRVELDNDVNAMTLGEFVFGAGRGCDNLVCITLGTGVGGGIIIGGKLYRGGSMTAGEIGHMPINEAGPKCNCRGIACLERYVGNKYILERAKKVFGNSITLERLSALARSGNKKAIAIWRDSAEKLSVAIIGVVNLLNPDKIVIGGGVSNAGSLILTPLKKEIKSRAMKDQAKHVKIVLAKLGRDAGIIGSSLLTMLKCIVYSVLLAMILNCGVAFAEDGTGSGKPIEVNGDQVEFFPKEKKIIGKGNVTIDYEGIKLTCDRITVYSETKDSEAEGNVVLQTAGSELKGEKITYNFGTKVGAILKARAKSGEWYIFGDKIELLSNATYRVIDGYLTSCGLHKPHYKIVAKTVTIDSLNNKVSAKDVTVKVGNTPIAYLPKYHFNMKTEGWPTVNVIPGKKSKWGVFALNSYRYEMDDKNALTFRVDERSKWGLAEGVDYKYALNGFGEGLLRTYYTNQRDVDRNEVEKGEQQRYRIQARHRWDINDHAMAIMEYHRMSDTTMTKDYFYREEYERESSPESYIYVLDRQPEYSLSFLGRKRTNHFQTVTERLPELRFDLKDQKLFDSPIYFKTDTTFTNLNQKTSANADDLNVTRFDVYNKLSAPLKLLDFISVSPFVGMRDTFFTRELNDDKDEFRTAFYTGIDLSTKFTRVYEASGKFMGVDFNKLHHIVTPTVEYRYIHQPSVDYTKLEQFDDIDAIDQKSVFTLGFENRLQTKRKIGESLKTVDLGYLLITSDYLYKPEASGSQFSNVKGDLELTPFNWLRFESDTRYDPDTRDFQTWNTDLYINKTEDWQLGFGSRYEQNKISELTSELFYKLNNEWSFRTLGRYDLKEIEDSGRKYTNEFKNKELGVIKDLHCWLAEASISSGRDSGTTLWFVMKLKASPKVPFDFKDYYPHPK